MDYKNIISRFLISLLMISGFIFLNYYYSSSLVYLVFLIYFIILIEILKYFKFNKFFFLTLIYLLFSLILFEIFLIYFYDFFLFTHFIFVIIIFDTFSYLGGSIFGRKKIFPNISPGKTFFGFFSGCLFVLIFSLLFNYIYPIYSENNIFLVSILIVITAFAGDIIESLFKRKSNLKDSSNFLPGHGGFFDRFDSIILSSYILIILNYLSIL